MSTLLVTKIPRNKMLDIIILPLVLYGCETYSLAMRDKHRRGIRM
jgi:hypothetical protein